MRIVWTGMAGLVVALAGGGLAAMTFVNAPDPQITAGITLPDRTAIDTARTGSAKPGPIVPETPAPGVDKAGRVDIPIDVLKTGLDALAGGNVAQARAIRDALPRDAVDRHVLEWAIALNGGPDVPGREIAVAARDLAGWPGVETFRRNGERALLRENTDPRSVIAAFKGTPPLTADGAIILARSLIATGDADAARTMLSAFWRTARLEAREEMAILSEFGALIPVADHRFRMERMLYAERTASAARVATLAGAQELNDAWSAVIRGQKTASKLLDAVPDAQRSAGYLFARTRLLRRADRIEDAARIMVSAPRDGAALVDPDAWWIERRALSRELLDAGDAKTAYEVAAAHAAESPVNMADAEFHAGWYAFRALGDAKLGATHFARIADVAGGAISLSRANYWLGRTAEAGAGGDAKDFYRKAATYGTTFYGQIAAQKLGLKTIDVSDPAPSDSERTAFNGREAVRAIGRLEAAGQPRLADRLYLDLADQLTSPGELALLAARAEARGNHFLALKVAKAAAARGVAIGALSHPVGAIPDSANIEASGKALAYAIARQESEFNTTARSGAGALGLLQLMPATAQDVARKAGLPYSTTRLTTDAAYNATLGAAFLNEQLGRFQGSYVLTFAGYNAGPKRARQWMARYGDPRGQDIEKVVDWIERIPYAETRAYVQRVMENYQVYKMRLTGSFNIVRDLTDGR
jgi:soluble lytic murein transglycosylase